MDRDTRARARAIDADPDASLELARRHLRGGDPAASLEALADELPRDLRGEASVIRAQAESDLGRPRRAAYAIRAARLASPDPLPDALLARVRAQLADLAAPGDEAPEEFERERLWLFSWLGGPGGALRARAEDASDWRVLVLIAGHEELAPELREHPDPFVRARACEGLVLAGHEPRGQDPVPALEALVEARFAHRAERHRASAHPLVRYLAAGAPELPVFPREPIPTRLFSAHGEDFQTGTFLSLPVLDASTEARLRLLTPQTFDLIDALCLEAFPWRVRGRGYGLALPGSEPRAQLQERVALLGLTRLLPLGIRLGQGHMFDVIAGEGKASDEDTLRETLARYLAADLCRHPARIEAEADHPLVYARLLAAFRPGKDLPERPAALLDEAARVYTSIGAAALEQFVEWGGHPQRGARRRDPYRT